MIADDMNDTDEIDGMNRVASAKSWSWTDTEKPQDEGNFIQSVTGYTFDFSRLDKGHFDADANSI